MYCFTADGSQRLEVLQRNQKYSYETRIFGKSAIHTSHLAINRKQLDEIRRFSCGSYVKFNCTTCLSVYIFVHACNHIAVKKLLVSIL